MSFAMSRQTQIETIEPLGKALGTIHFRFSGDYRTFCGRKCDGWVKSGTDPALDLDSPHCCSQCRTAYLK